MSWKHWTAVALVIGIGIVLQIPRHEESAEDHAHPVTGTAAVPVEPSDPTRTAEPVGPYRTIALEVTGMT